MTEFDRKIESALAEDERALLARIGAEDGYFTQIAGLFGGRTGWAAMVLVAAQAAMFGAGAYAAWKFFAAADALTALRWGLPAATLLLASLVTKLAFWPTLHINRVIAELRRLEVEVIRRQG